MRRGWRVLDRWAIGLALFLVVDRLIKFAAVVHFFRQVPPPLPSPSSLPSPTALPASEWPSVTMLSPITCGVADLTYVLRCRGQLAYAGSVQHLLICDAADQASLAICHAWAQENSHLEIETVSVQVAGQEAGQVERKRIAGKIEKLNAALPLASGDIFCFVDDDVCLRSHTLQTLIPYLLQPTQPQVGAVFGLACYTAWHNLSTSLMSAFVNSNALMSYIPLTYLTDPYTITGHCYAMRRSVFATVHGLEEMEGRLDDDHELALRLRRLGYRCVQTPLIYDVENYFDTISAYAKQMKRWFIIPRQVMVAVMSLGQQGATLLGSLSTFLLPVLALCALLSRRARVKQAFAGVMILYNAIFWLSEKWYLQRATPWQWWSLLSLTSLVAPLQIVTAMLSKSEFTWRGQRLRLHRGGHVLSI